VPVFIWSPEEEGTWAPGSASRWWLHQSLQRLDEALRGLGSRLLIRRGPSLAALEELVDEIGAGAVYWNHRYEQLAIARDTTIKNALRKRPLTVVSFKANLLREPTEVRTKQGRPFQVFTPFWKTCTAGFWPELDLKAPERLPGERRSRRDRTTLEDLKLEPTIDWAAGLRQTWTPGEEGAWQRLREFLQHPLGSYASDRERPDLDGTSCLSPHLHFGEISPRSVWHAVADHLRLGPGATWPHGAEVFLRELGWREFAYHLLCHFPHTPDRPLRQEFEAFPWRQDRPLLRAWQRGRTGYPLVDAGMRQLWATGWMHNRVRMVTASFLVKDLLLPWLEGARWFWDTLVDADLANNSLGWQWSSGCGADAAPYFRIFNPVSQAEKFDPSGVYVRRWVPELARLPLPWLHRPWQAAPAVLDAAGVRLGQTYPFPVVDHAEARRRALAAFATL
jgi:deoxyribodipyrimidine photo-lyase